MSITANQVRTAIMTGGFTNEDLEAIIESIKYRRSQIAKQKINTFKVGARVKWYGRNGHMTGTVSKIGVKNLVISTAQGAWRVPANMLESA